MTDLLKKLTERVPLNEQDLITIENMVTRVSRILAPEFLDTLPVKLLALILFASDRTDSPDQLMHGIFMESWQNGLLKAIEAALTQPDQPTTRH